MSRNGRQLALIVDDEPDIRELMALTLDRMGVEVCTVGNLTEAREALATRRFDLCLSDMRLPDGNGIELVREIQLHHPETPVAIITAHGNMESAIEALKAGAFDFVTKPIELLGLRSLINKALRLADTYPQRDRRSRAALIGDSAVMQAIRSTILKLARSQAPVYISGESGTGKELVARLIHEKSPRAECPFIAVNCGAIPAELMESELFGYKKGSFTGATADKDGLFQAAHGGTLFLDEVADLPLTMQVKLLRAIQEKAVRPLGAQREVTVDVRILSATHKDLAELVRAGRFREDLYYRINVIELHVPSLKERREDIPQLAEHILQRLLAKSGQSASLGAEAVRALCNYPFPGNVRELENILERALTLCEGSVIRAADLGLPRHDAAQAAAVSDRALPLESYLAAVEKEAILKALAQTRYNRTAAARVLGISFRALRYRLKKLGID